MRRAAPAAPTLWARTFWLLSISSGERRFESQEQHGGFLRSQCELQEPQKCGTGRNNQEFDMRRAKSYIKYLSRKRSQEVGCVVA
jgi:hypothetical protein